MRGARAGGFGGCRFGRSYSGGNSVTVADVTSKNGLAPENNATYYYIGLIYVEQFFKSFGCWMLEANKLGSERRG